MADSFSKRQDTAPCWLENLLHGSEKKKRQTVCPGVFLPISPKKTKPAGNTARALPLSP